MTSVSIWQHVLVVLTLLTTNATTFFIAKRRIETLQMALVAKRVLLGPSTKDIEGDHNLFPSNPLILQDASGNFMEISCDIPTIISIRLYDR